MPNPGPATNVSEHPIGGGQGPYYIGGPGSLVGFFQDPYGATFTGSISGTTLTVISLVSGAIALNQPFTAGAAAGTTITAFGTGVGGNTAAALGTYTVSVSQTVAAITTFQTGGAAVAQQTGGVTGSQSIGLYSTSQAGTITKYQVSVVTNSVAATTTVEQTSSVGSSTSNVWTGPATSSIVFYNSPASTAGLAPAGIRVSSGTGTSRVAINYVNVSNAAINIATGSYDFVEIQSGPLTTTATLSPAVVPFNTSQEQIFTITGQACVPGTVGIVNKPTAQTGLGYSPFCRVVGINQVGVTFFTVSTGAATTGAGVTPTAAEAYQFAFLPRLNAYNPTYVYTVPAGQNSSTASTTLEQTSAVTGLLATDVVTGIQRATTQAGSGIVGARVTSAGVIGITYMQPGAAVTPTSSEVYAVTIQRQVPLNPNMLYSATLATSAVAATTTVEVTTTVTGLLVSSSVAVNKPSVTPGLVVVNARVSAANTLAVTYANVTGTSINVPSETYAIANVQLQGPGVGIVSSGATAGAGLSVSQSYFPSLDQTLGASQALRSAMVNMGMISGA